MKKKIHQVSVKEKLNRGKRNITIILFLIISVILFLFIRITRNYDYFYHNSFQSVQMSQEIRNDLETIEKNILKGIALHNKEIAANCMQETDSSYIDIKKMLDEMEVKNPEYQSVLSQVKNFFVASQGLEKSISNDIQDENYEGALLVYNNQYRLLTEEAKKTITKLSNKAVLKSEQDYNAAQVMKFTVLGVSTLLFIIGFCSIRKVLKKIFDDLIEPIEELQDCTNQITKGNLNTKVKVYRDDELGKLADSMNQMAQNLSMIISNMKEVTVQLQNNNFVLEITEDYYGDFTLIKESLQNIILTFREIIGDIKECTVRMTINSENLDAMSDEILSATDEQTDSIQELEDVMKMIVGYLEHNHSSARMSQELMDSCEKISMEGRKHMDKMIVSLQEINSKSQETKKILIILQEISQRVKLLSFNASIEAVNAGENGKGFLVVAREMGNLAEQSANAVEDARKMIENEEKATLDGNNVAKQTFQSFHSLEMKINDIKGLIEKNAGMFLEQLGSVDSIKKEVNHLLDINKRNRENSDKCLEVSQSMEETAQGLVNMTEKFII